VNLHLKSCQFLAIGRQTVAVYLLSFKHTTAIRAAGHRLKIERQLALLPPSN